MQAICVAGKNEIAIEGLRYVVDIYPDSNIFFIPNKNDLGVDTWQPSFKKYALGRGIKQVNLEDLYEIENLVFLSLEFDRIISPKKFRGAQLFNVHFSLLPKYKGMYTSALPLLHGEVTSGVTLHFIDAGIDTGDIIAQIEFDIDPGDNARDLYFRYLANSKKLLRSHIDSILSGEFSSIAQESMGASYYSKSSINYSSLSIDFNKCAFEISNQFRAFTFREYQVPRFEGWQIIGTEILLDKSHLKPGAIVSEDSGSFVISTVDYDLKLKKDYYPILWVASESGDVLALELALKFVDDINARNENGWSALILASYHGQIALIDTLLNCGASMSVVGYNGTTPLMYAFSYYERHGDERAFKMLLSRGADVSAVDNAGKSLRDYMIERNCLGLIQYA
ncbi:ankyrin repeat domain-containing protein [Pseudomonas sp. SWRI18]|uniref:formyltransferase family protein n=1 Tax=Pseudomonas sp. SWRI18 TaxID=2753888 RepID=UPI0016471E07|nr:formyltransferase family protein [Pseudomonas sp. SWRI18]MBC3303296.1 ankyrin repeat domain-containing protein [Pseudomonas sp. SWRI18]